MLVHYDFELLIKIKTNVFITAVTEILSQQSAINLLID